MDLDAWVQSQEDGRPVFLLLGEPLVHSRAASAPLGGIRGSIIAILLGYPDGLDMVSLKSSLWPDEDKSDANVRRHIRLINQLAHDFGIDEKVVVSRSRDLRGFLLRDDCCEFDIDRFRSELLAAVSAWSTDEILVAESHAVDAISYWRSNSPLVRAPETPAVRSVVAPLNHDLRVALWILARCSVVTGNRRVAIERLQWALAGEHEFNVGLSAILIFLLNQAGRRAEALTVVDRIAQTFGEGAPELERCIAVDLASRSTEPLTTCLEQFDTDFGVASLPSLVSGGVASSTHSDEPPIDLTEPRVVELTGPAVISGGLAGGSRSLEAPGFRDVVETPDVTASTETDGSTSEVAVLRSQASGDPIVIREPKRGLQSRWKIVVGALVVLTTLLALRMLTAGSAKELVVADFESAESIDDGWSMTEEAVDEDYLVDQSGSVSLARARHPRGDSLRIVANPEAVPGKSHHVSVGHWLPGDPELGIYELSFSVYLPDSSSLLTQTGPEASVQITRDGVTTIAAIQAVPNPWVREVNIWSTTDQGPAWRSLSIDYEPVIDDWVDITMTFDLETGSYIELRLDPGSSGDVLELDLNAMPVASDNRGFADGVVVTLEAENLWSDEVNPVSARSEIFYDDVTLLLR